MILADLSYARRDQAETPVLFELVAERYENQSLAINANTPFSQWSEVFVEPAMTLAAVDRLVHHSTILEMNVESYRRRAAQKGLIPAGLKARLPLTTTKSPGQNSWRRAVKIVDADQLDDLLGVTLTSSMTSLA